MIVISGGVTVNIPNSTLSFFKMLKGIEKNYFQEKLESDLYRSVLIITCETDFQTHFLLF